MTFSKTIPKTITVSSNTRPHSPSFSIKNPQQKDIFVTKIELIPSDSFSGDAIVKLNGISILDTQADNIPLTKFLIFDVPLDNNVFERSQALDFFVWGIDAESMSLDVKVTISESDKKSNSTSIIQPRNDRNRGTPETLTLTTPDGGSGIIATAYTCPAGFQAKVIEFVSLVDNFGSTDEIDLWLVDTRMARWHLTAGDRRLPHILYSDFIGQELDEGQSIYFDGDFTNNFNATIKVAYTVLETRKL